MPNRNAEGNNTTTNPLKTSKVQKKNFLTNQLMSIVTANTNCYKKAKSNEKKLIERLQTKNISQTIKAISLLIAVYCRSRCSLCDFVLCRSIYTIE